MMKMSKPPPPLLPIPVPFTRKPAVPAAGGVTSKIGKGLLVVEFFVGVLYTLLMSVLIFRAYWPLVVTKTLKSGETKEITITLNTTEFFFVILFFITHLYTVATLWTAAMERSTVALSRWVNIRGVVATLLTALVLAHFLVHGHAHGMWIGMMAYSYLTMGLAVEYGNRVKQIKLDSLPKPRLLLHGQPRTVCLQCLFDGDEKIQCYNEPPAPPRSKKANVVLNV